MLKFTKQRDKIIPINTDADKKLKNDVKTDRKELKDRNFITDNVIEWLKLQSKTTSP